MKGNNGQSGVSCRVGGTCYHEKYNDCTRPTPVDVINAVPNSVHVQEMTGGFRLMGNLCQKELETLANV